MNVHIGAARRSLPKDTGRSFVCEKVCEEKPKETLKAKKKTHGGLKGRMFAEDEELEKTAGMVQELKAVSKSIKTAQVSWRTCPEPVQYKRKPIKPMLKMDVCNATMVDDEVDEDDEEDWYDDVDKDWVADDDFEKDEALLELTSDEPMIIEEVQKKQISTLRIIGKEKVIGIHGVYLGERWWKGYEKLRDLSTERVNQRSTVEDPSKCVIVLSEDIHGLPIEYFGDVALNKLFQQISTDHWILDEPQSNIVWSITGISKPSLESVLKHSGLWSLGNKAAEQVHLMIYNMLIVAVVMVSMIPEVYPDVWRRRNELVFFIRTQFTQSKHKEDFPKIFKYCSKIDKEYPMMYSVLELGRSWDDALVNLMGI